MDSSIREILNNSYPRWQTHQVLPYCRTLESTEMPHGNTTSTAFILHLQCDPLAPNITLEGLTVDTQHPSTRSSPNTLRFEFGPKKVTPRQTFRYLTSSSFWMSTPSPDAGFLTCSFYIITGSSGTRPCIIPPSQLPWLPLLHLQKVLLHLDIPRQARAVPQSHTVHTIHITRFLHPDRST